MENIGSSALLITIIAYFLLLYLISYFTSRKADNLTFFNAHKSSSWILVAIGMIGASLSGATFISIPGVVGAEGANQGFSYMQMVMGYLLGYAIIAFVLMPIYYRQKLISIYGFLERRFGQVAYKSGAFYFLLSRLLGASFRLYLVALVLHPFVLKPMGISFEFTVAITLILIWVYTFKGGIKTIVWTDTLQTVTMLIAVCLSLYAISDRLGYSIIEIPDMIRQSPYSKVFHFGDGWQDPNNFFKQLMAGMLIAVVMTGLDQDMMQKNLTCRSLGDAQKNVFLFSIILVFANLLFLSLGASLYIFAHDIGLAIPEKTDQLFPLIAFEHMSPLIAISFVIGLIAAAYSSADSALTALTTSFCIDFLDFEKDDRHEKLKAKTRRWVHIGFTVLLFLIIVTMNKLNNDAVINGLLLVAAYTYGPLLGMFAFGILSRGKPLDRWIWLVVIVAPVLSYIINVNSSSWFGGLELGFLVLALNGLLTFIGLYVLSLINAAREGRNA